MRSLISVVATIIFIFAGVALSCPADGTEDCCDAKWVRSVVELPLGMPGNDGGLATTIYRSGDRMALGIVRAFTEEELADPGRQARIISIVWLSFSRPNYITRDEDKNPAVTFLLLRLLESQHQDASLLQSIQATEKYVSKQTGSKWLMP
ncbi:MAG: hypothetical protein WB716_00220 [Candidatus Acidiferrales bacterium]